MLVDHLDLINLGLLVKYAVKNAKENEKEFYENIQRALEPFLMMEPLMQYAWRSNLIIPFQLAMDLNSVAREFGDIPKEEIKRDLYGDDYVDS